MSKDRKIVSRTNISIDLNQIPEDEIKKIMKKNDTEGRFVSLVIFNFDTEDDYGKSASVAISMSKEEKDAGKEQKYIGGGWYNKVDQMPF